MSYKGVTFGAHNLADFFARGLIAPGLQVLHTCDNRLCVDPEHTYRGTHADNMRDMVVRGRSRNQWTARG